MEPRLQTPPSPEMGNVDQKQRFSASGERYQAPSPERQLTVELPSSEEARSAVQSIQFDSSGAPGVQAVADSGSGATDDSSLVANDDDLIQKEWIAKAKAIVARTKDDPYQQEDQVSKLQGDYLKKRYGKNVGLGSA